MNEELKRKWVQEISEVLVGKSIVRVDYLTKEEMSELGIARSGIVLVLNDQNCIFPMSDDEGNDAGSLFTTYERLPVIPTIY